MDFRTCPACTASILDDDAVDCPSCGASLATGKPAAGAKSRAPAKAAPSSTSPPVSPPPPTAGKPSPAGAGAKPKPAAAAKSKAREESADPFDVDTSAARKAIPVKPRPSKGYMIRVTCPMCERPGFISEREVGKEVKCCNPECLVPVFVAKPPQEPEPEAEPEPTGGNRLFLLGGLGIVAIGVVVAVMFVLPSKPKGTGPINLPPSGGEQGGQQAIVDGESPPKVAPQLPLTPEAVFRDALAGMREASERALNQRDRGLASRMLAEALVRSGDEAAAKSEMQSLASGDIKYLAIAPLVLEAWQQLDAGKSAAARAALDQAWALQGELPKQGRDALDVAGPLAAALVVAGRVDDARTLVEARNDPVLGQLSTMWRATVDGGDFRIDQVSRRSCLQEIPHPQWASVTQVLAAHRQLEAAQAWALAAPDAEVRDNCCAVLAAQVTLQGGAAAERTDLVAKLTAAVDAAGQARIYCAVGQVLLERGDRAGATEMAARAQESLGSVAPPPPVAIPEMLPLYELAAAPNKGLPPPAPHRTAALAAMDLFELQSQLNEAEALPWLTRVLEFTRGTAPGVPGTAALLKEIDESPAATRRRFAQALNIEENAAFAQFSRYQQQVKAWHDRAEERRGFEVRLLTRAALGGQAAEVWKRMQAAAGSTDAPQSYLGTSLPGLILLLAQTDKLADLQQAVQAANPEPPPVATPTDRLLVALRLRHPAQDWSQLRRELQEYYGRRVPDHHLVDIAVMSLLVAQQESQLLESLQRATQLPDPLLLEDTLFLIGARGIALQQARQLFAGFDARSYGSSAAIALYRGCVEGAALVRSQR